MEALHNHNMFSLLLMLLLYGSFMQSEYVLSTSSVVEVSMENEYYLPVAEVFLGDATLEYLQNTDEKNSFDLKLFRETCQLWWCRVAKEALTRLPGPLSEISNGFILAYNSIAYQTKFKLLLNSYLRL